MNLNQNDSINNIFLTQTIKNEVCNMSIDEMSYLQSYIEKIKRSKIQKKIINQDTKYYNPYEYGPKQKLLPPQYIRNTPINKINEYTDHIRNIDVESALQQKECVKIPGQKKVMQKEMNRFHLLPYDAQDPKHIVWFDGMPRGGYSTRVDRTE